MKIKHIAIATALVTATGVAIVSSNEPSDLQTKTYVDQVYTPGLPRILPDATMTPGAMNPDITQDNISQNICNPSWSTKSIRPPVSYTTPLKIKQISQYGYADTATASYEEDHLISLELGGSPTDPLNLWPEAYNTTPGAKQKDLVENYLHKQVCAGAVSLQEAQTEISTDWTTVYKMMAGNTILGGSDAYVDEGDN